jgi:hypothetical protein
MASAEADRPRDDLADRRARVALDPVAVSVSRRHWQRVAGDAKNDEDVAAAADRMCLQLENGLSRWIGLEGYKTLQDRAIHEVVEHHPALSKLSFGAGDEAANHAAVQEHGAVEVADGMVALVAAVIELLGRIIGVDMALRLVEHWGDRARAES